MNFRSDVMRKRRNQFRWSYDRLAIETGLSRFTLMNMEKPDANPQATSVIAVARALKLDPSKFFEDLSQPEPALTPNLFDDVPLKNAA